MSLGFYVLFYFSWKVFIIFHQNVITETISRKNIINQLDTYISLRTLFQEMPGTFKKENRVSFDFMLSEFLPE